MIEREMGSRHERRKLEYFDTLPDDLLEVIFNKLVDAKSLCRCFCVCKRFASIVTQTGVVSLTIRDTNNDNPGLKPRSGTSTNFVKSLVKKLITKPLQFLHHHLFLPKFDSSHSRNSPYEALKIFNEIRNLHIELPSHLGDVGSDGSGGWLLRWKAEFGVELESCVLLGAKSLKRKREHKLKTDDQQNVLIFTHDDLKLRVVWIISCLIAASARHYLLREIVRKHRLLQRISITDSSKQGRVCMGQEQIEKLRNLVNSSVVSESPLERTRVPDLSIRLWYLPELELPVSGYVMEGATLVVIRPVEWVKGINGDADILAGAFEGEEDGKMLGEAVRATVTKKSSYLMEMNSF